jgi:hypothetical protein
MLQPVENTNAGSLLSKVIAVPGARLTVGVLIISTGGADAVGLIAVIAVAVGVELAGIAGIAEAVGLAAMVGAVDGVALTTSVWLAVGVGLAARVGLSVGMGLAVAGGGAEPSDHPATFAGKSAGSPPGGRT